jgi:hypothetical protein
VIGAERTFLDANVIANTKEHGELGCFLLPPDLTVGEGDGVCLGTY